MYARPLEISSLTKIFDTPDGPVTVVKDFTLRVAPGEFVALLGHSGCGKSTVLSILAGLQEASFGGVIVDGKEVVEPGLERAFVFQSPSLLPWLTASANVELAARQAHPDMNRKDIQALVDRYLNLVGAEEFASELPAEMSQGTQQRVSLARALSQEPRYLLLDEPFGMLDSITRFELQELVQELWKRDRKTVVMVTHDIDEALYLSDRIILMTDGPEARVGLDLAIPMKRPRSRQALAENKEYFALRARIIDFLESHTKQFTKSPEVVHEA